MAIVESLTTLKAVVKLDDGYTTSGAIKTVNQALGGASAMSISGWDADKAMAIFVAMSPILSKSPVGLTKTADYSVYDDS